MSSSGFYCFFMILALLPAFAGSAEANQIVTPDTREWAQRVIKEEKTLRTTTADNTLAVLYFSNRTGLEELDPLRKGLALILITDLSTVKNLQVVERIRIQALAEELGLGTSGLVEPGTAPRVGRLLGAKWLVGGDIAGALARLRVSSDILDVPGGQVLGRPASDGALEELFRVEKDLLFEILQLVKIEITPTEEATLRKPCSKKSTALMALFKGIDAGDRGEYEKASGHYEQALREDPEICLAGEALEELQTLGLYPVKKKSGDMLRSLRDGTSLTNQLTPQEELRGIPAPTDVPVPANRRTYDKP